MDILCCVVPGPEDGGDGVSFTPTFRRSRKKRSCCECDVGIKPGERYVRDAGFSDGSAWHYNTCLPCLELRERYCCNGWWFGQLHQDLRDYVAPGLDSSHRKGLSDAAWERLWEAYLDWRSRALRDIAQTYKIARKLPGMEYYRLPLALREEVICEQEADWCLTCRRKTDVTSVAQEMFGGNVLCMQCLQVRQRAERSNNLYVR